MRKNKYIITIFCFLAIFCICQNVLALDVGINYNEPSGLGAQDIRITIAKIIGAGLGFLGIVFILIIITAGVYYFLNKQDTEKVEKAKKIIISAVIGLIIVLSAYTIVNFIVSAIIGEQQGGTPQNTNTNENNNTNENENNNTNNNENTNINGGLPTNNCTGNIPYAVLCEGTEQGLSEPTQKILVPDCTYEQKCEYVCQDNFIYIDGQCYGCSGDNPANAFSCGDYTNDTGVIPKIIVNACTDTRNCEFFCKNYYILSGDSCIPNPFTCQGPTFDHASLCYLDDKNLTADTNRTLVKLCTANKKCEYKCSSTYILSNGACIPNPYVCLGAIADATLCPNSNIDLPADTNTTLVNNCSGSYCQAKCNLGFAKNGDVCQAIKYAIITADNYYDLYINNQLVGSNDDWYASETYDISSKIVSGENIIAIRAYDTGGGFGLIAKFGDGYNTYVATGDSGWKCINLGKNKPDGPAGWQTLGFDDSSWTAPAVPSPGTISSWANNINIPNAQWIWTPTGTTYTTILCRYKFST